MKKPIPSLILLMALPLASMAEPETNASPAKTELTTAKDSSPPAQPDASTMAEKQALQNVGERIALSGKLTTAPPSKARKLVELVNPFAPVQPKPQTRWIERSAWSTVAATAAGSMTPVEVRHEAKFGLSIAAR